MLNEIQPHLKEVLFKLAGSRFNRNNPHKIQEYENSGVSLNDSNLNEYLSELEEYTNAILLYKGKSSNQPTSEVFAKTLLLDELNPKEFKKKIYVNFNHNSGSLSTVQRVGRHQGQNKRDIKDFGQGSTLRHGPQRLGESKRERCS